MTNSFFMLTIQQENDKILYREESAGIISRSVIQVKDVTGKTYSFPIHYQDNKISANLGIFGQYTEKIIQHGQVVSTEILLDVKTNTQFVVYCPFELSKTGEKPYFMIPGVIYGSNNFENAGGRTPKFKYGGKTGFPVSSKFIMRADRSPYPGVITIKNGQVFMVGIDDKVKNVQLNPEDKWSPAYLYNGLILDSSQDDDDIIGFTIGYEHFPKRFSWEWEIEKVPLNNEYRYGWITGMKGRSLETKGLYYSSQAEDKTAYGKAIRFYYNQIHEFPKKRSGRDEAIEKMADVIIHECWLPKDKIFYLSDHTDSSQIGDIAWTGGMQVAYPLIKAGQKLKKQIYIDRAVEFINELVKNGFNEDAGLFYEEKRYGEWKVTGWWGYRKDCLDFGDNPQHSAYLNGQASYYLLRCYELLGKKESEWLSRVRTVIETAIRNQKESGGYPCFFDPRNGNGLDYDGFQSCWFVPAATLLYKLTGEEIYLQSAEKAIDHYYTWHLKGELYGTPMDTHKAVDEEGNLAFVSACVELHKATGKNTYIEYGKTGLDWEFTWKFPRNVEFSNDPLRSLNWSSSGGSITSTHNPHIHPMGNLIAAEMYYLWQQTKDEYIYNRLKDTCIWGLGCFNRFHNEFGFGKTGYSTEQFFYTDALVCPWWRPWDGGVWEANLSWASACYILSAADDIPDEFFRTTNAIQQ